MEIPSAHLKAIFFTHFILIIFGIHGILSPLSYIFYNLFFLLALVWGIYSTDSSEPIFMGLVIDGASILLDIILITVFYPYNIEFGFIRFSIGMAILNLILRPISCIVLYRIQNERAGNYNNFGIPGLGDYFGRRGPYENIDQPTSQTVPQTTVDTGSPQHLNFGTEKPMPHP